MNVLNEAILPTVTAILGGIGVYIFQRFYERVESGESGADFRQYSGQWRGCHVTADPQTGRPVYSHHIYTLVVRRNGQIKGKVADLIGDPPWEYSTTGQVYPGAIVMTHRGKQRPEIIVVEMYKTGLNAQRMVGMISTSTYDKDMHFASPIVLSRRQVSDDDFREAMKTQTTAFYGELDQNLGLPPKMVDQASSRSPVFPATRPASGQVKQ